MKYKNSDGVGVFFSAYIWLKEENCCHWQRNNRLLDNANIPPGRRTYVSKLTPTAIVLLNREELETIMSDSTFSDWSVYDFDQPQKNSDEIILGQIGADKINGTNSPFFNDGMGYTGKGVKVGIISAENLIFDSKVLSLQGVDITVLPSLLPPKTDTHPTAVISQIAGKTVEINGRELYGVVGDASVYFASTKTAAGVYSAIEAMAERGVGIINYSAGSVKGEYSDFDRQIDRLIRHGNFLFVTASGNQRSMTSPGRAENALTVGNIQTKEYPDTALSPPWSVWCKAEDDCSGFSGDGVPKPDAVAPGTWVGYAETETYINFNNFGTSFACPWVSGIAVAITEALGRPVSYLTVKAIILMSCNRSAVSDVGNPETSEYTRLRSGYGMLDGRRAVEVAEKCLIYESRLEGEYNIEVTGRDITAMLVFERDENGATVVFDGESYFSGNRNTILIEKRPKENISPLSVIGLGGRFSLVIIRNT